MLKRNEILSIIKAAKAGGKVTKGYFGKSLDVVEKSCAWDFRTQADVESEEAILKILKKAFPNYSIHSEGSGFLDKKSDYVFYVDPLDGTNNFVLGIPNFSVLISLANGKEVIFGLVYLPMLDLCYTAELGKGAFCNGNRISPSVEKNMANATIGYACGYKTEKEEIVRVVSNLKIKGRIKRTLFNWAPGTDFCLLASGRIESMINFNTEIYDFLGSKLILKEAGCIVTDFEGNPSEDFDRSFVASCNNDIQNAVLTLV